MKLRIAHKLPLVVTCAALAVAVVTGGVSLWLARDALRSAYEEQLLSLLETRRVALRDYVQGVRNDLDLLAQSGNVLRAMDGFNIGRTAIPFDKNQILRQAFVENNPHPPAERDKFLDPRDGMAYSGTHRRNHPFFRNFLDKRGYADLFLVGPKGNVVYSVKKKDDYARNLNKGDWAKTALAKAVAAARESAEPGFHAFADFTRYRASGGAPAAFVVTPVHGDTSREMTAKKGEPIGYLVFQLSGDKLNTVMAQTVGMGETGEIFVVGQDHLMRSDSPILDGSQVLLRQVTNPAVEAALAGRTGVREVTSLTGQPALALYAPFDVLGTRWALVAEKELGEITAPIMDLLWRMALVSLVAALLVAAGGLLVARGIARPIKAMTGAMKALAGGDKDVEIPGAGRSDEIGDMAEAVQVFRDNMREAERLAAEQRTRQEQELARGRRLQDLTKAFDATAADVLGRLTDTTGELQGTADSMRRIAEGTNAKARAAATASDEASASVQTVASASEELGRSIEAIASQIGTATEVAGGAVDEAQRASRQVRGLSAAADKIGEVVVLIQDIAEQTNLLALNATIEAARAGEAGKGFAVVAHEVKALATQTAKATEDIAEHVRRVQSETSDIVTVIERIGTAIRSIDAQARSVSEAIDQQRGATREIAENVQQAAQGARRASGHIAEVSQAAGATDAAAGEVVNTVEALSTQSGRLSQAVDSFLSEVRAA